MIEQNPQNVAICSALILLPAVFFFIDGKKNSLGIFCVALYLWHTFWCLIYFLYTLAANNDSVAYYYGSPYLYAVSNTRPIVLFAHDILRDTLGFSLLAVFLIFNILGAAGILMVYKRCTQALKSSRKIFIVQSLLFLPGISFWSSAIGKDSLAVFFIGVWCSRLSDKLSLKTLLWQTLALIGLLFIRPHIAALALISLCISYFIKFISPQSRGGSYLALFVTLPLLALLAFLSKDLLVHYLDALNVITEQRQALTEIGGSAVNLDNMNVFQKYFTYLFKPLGFENGSIFSSLAGIENLFLLFLLSSFAATAPIFNLRPRKGAITCLLFSTIGIVAMSTITSNLGIASRQKWMFVLPLIQFLSLIQRRSRRAC